ncbi:hypothetical protein CLOM_g5968 [Closterium sp. NIES-68]|nr:hypothetical protein CLOM_g5968 [Closterium sp. NIES-68]
MWFVSVKTLASFYNSHVKSSFVRRMCFFYFVKCEVSIASQAISSKWLFKRKTDADGNIERYKSRLVAKGYQQQEKKDYNEVYAPVVKGTTLRTLFAAAAIKGWVVKQMDIVTAFLNGVAAGERVAKYLGQTATVGLQYSAAAQRRQKGADGVEPGRLFLTAFSDASWASEPEDMTSVKWHWVRSMVTAGEVELHYVKTTAQPADMMTKRLVEQQHWKCCKLAGMALN